MSYLIDSINYLKDLGYYVWKSAPDTLHAKKGDYPDKDYQEFWISWGGESNACKNMNEGLERICEMVFEHETKIKNKTKCI